MLCVHDPNMKKLILPVSSLLVCLLLGGNLAFGQIPTTWGNQTIPAGSKIIDMGVTPQTIANGLIPYGMVYDLLKNYNVPILWAIKPNKLKDASDFTQDGVTYYGGPFIIEAGYLTTAVNTAITSWVNQGVVVRTTTTAGSIPIFAELNQAPVWVINTDNNPIPVSFFADANIPSSAYAVRDPTTLTSCDNIFVMPHADPAWATHNKLFNWLKSVDSTGGYQGWLWSGCHAASVVENTYNTSIPWQKMNFLTTNGLVAYGSHHDGSTPYVNDSFPSNPLMQFMSTIDGATTNGSEQIYLPALSSAWRSTTKVGVYDASQQDVPGLSPGKAALFAFGPAWGDYNNGYVAYEAGHNVSGNKTWNIAAERLFFNFSFLAPVMQTRTFNINSYNIPDTMYSGNTYALSVNVSGNTGPFTYQWSSTCAGAAFTSPTSASTNVTMPSAGSCIVKCVVTSQCTRVEFKSRAVTVFPIGVLPLQLANYSLRYVDNRAKLYWEVANDAGYSKYVIERSVDGMDFSEVGSVLVDAANHGIYYFEDASINNVMSELFYYRIRLTANNHPNKLSPVMSLHRELQNISRPTIKPNPAKDFITLSEGSQDAPSAA